MHPVCQQQGRTLGASRARLSRVSDLELHKERDVVADSPRDLTMEHVAISQPRCEISAHEKVTILDWKLGPSPEVDLELTLVEPCTTVDQDPCTAPFPNCRMTIAWPPGLRESSRIQVAARAPARDRVQGGLGDQREALVDAGRADARLLRQPVRRGREGQVHAGGTRGLTRPGGAVTPRRGRPDAPTKVMPQGPGPALCRIAV